MAAKINTGSVAVKATRPVWKRETGWRLVGGRVAADSPEAAASFAADLVASYAARRRGEDIRRETGWPRIDYSRDIYAYRSDSREWRRTDDVDDDGYPILVAGPSMAEVDWRGTSCVRPMPTDRYAMADAAETLADRAPTPMADAHPPKSSSRAVKRTPRATSSSRAADPVAAEDPKGPCPRCRRIDWRTPAGRTWHIENNPDCAKYVNPAAHKYAA